MTAIMFEKHMIECKCILPQFKNSNPIIWHKFIVFSEINQHGNIIPSFSQCNNCGVIHRVTEIGISTILRKDELQSLPTIEDINTSIPTKITEILEKYNCILSTYQEVAFIFEHKMWGKIVILSKELIESNTMVGKYIQILGDSLWKISSFEEENFEH